MAEKILLKDFAKFYIGCKIELAEFRFVEVEHNRILTLGGVTETKFYVPELDCWYAFGEYYTGESHDKLVLRPLSSITTWEQLERSKYIINCETEFTETFYHKWMLSKHFDIFGLIEPGLIAIDETKIIPNEEGTT